MEPLTVATIAALAFDKFLGSSATELGKKFTQTAIEQMDRLRQLISEKLNLKSKSQEAITKVKQGSKEDLQKVVSYLEVAMDDDEEFASQIQQLAQQINAGKIQDNSSMTQVNQDNAKGWQTKVEDGTAYIGDITINQSTQSK